MATFLFRLGRLAARRAWVVVFIWALLLAGLGGAAGLLAKPFSTELTIPGSEFQKVLDDLKTSMPDSAGGSGSLVFRTNDDKPFTSTQKAAVVDQIARWKKISGVTGATDPFTLQQQLDDAASKVTEGKQQLADGQAEITTNTQKLAEAQQKLDTGQQQLDDNSTQLAQGQAQLAAGEQKIASGQSALDSNAAKLAAAKAELETNAQKLASGRAQLVANEQKLSDGRAQLTAAKAQLTTGQQQLDAAKAQLAAGKPQLDAAVAQLATAQQALAAEQQQVDDLAAAKGENDPDVIAARQQLAQATAAFAAQKAQVDGQVAQYNATSQQLTQKQAELTAGAQQLAAKEAQLNAGASQLAAARRQLDAGDAALAAGRVKLAQGDQQLAAGQAQVSAGAAAAAASRTTLAAGAAKLDAGKVELTNGRTQLADGQAQLAQAQAQVTSGAAQLRQGERRVALMQGMRVVSKDGTAALGTISFAEPLNEISNATLTDVRAESPKLAAAGVHIDYSKELTEENGGFFGPGEAAGLVVASLVLLVMLGSLVAAGLPLVTALVGVGVGLLGVVSATHWVGMTDTAPVLALMLGLAVGIDYALFLVNRHREQLRDGVGLEESIGRATGTAGSAVSVAGMTVIVALAALTFSGIPFLGVMGIAAAATVAVAVLVSLTLIPALLRLIGFRVLPRADRRALQAKSLLADGAEAEVWPAGEPVVEYPADSSVPDGYPADQPHLTQDSSRLAGDRTGFETARLDGTPVWWPLTEEPEEQPLAQTTPQHAVPARDDFAHTILAPTGYQPSSSRRGGWGALVTRHPVLTLLATVAVLGTLALPASALRLGLPDGGSEPTASTAYRAYSTVADKFGPGQNAAILAVAKVDGKTARGLTEAQLTDLELDVAERLHDTKGVAYVVPAGASKDRKRLLFQVVPTTGPSAEATITLVHKLRSERAAILDDTGIRDLGFAGQTVADIDISELLAQALPTYLTIVVGISLVLLLLVFRSIVVPVLATGGFLLSIAASFGAMVAVYQWGWLGWLFGVEHPGPILSFLPTLAIGIVFGLAMDYQMFLVSGMREAWAHGSPARLAVRQGFSHGARVVTAAALIMTAVFSSFVFSHMTMIRPIGFSLASGVLLDAFVVRMTAMPALMHLLGERAWYLPAWLDRMLPDLDVEGTRLVKHLEQEHAAARTQEIESSEPAPELV